MAMSSQNEFPHSSDQVIELEAPLCAEGAAVRVVTHEEAAREHAQASPWTGLEGDGARLREDDDAWEPV